MKPLAFDYVAPGTVDEAIKVLRDLKSEARILAGGQSLVPLLNMRLARPSVVVDINRIRDLNYLRLEQGELAVGALVRHSDVLTSPLVREGWPLLAEATYHVGYPAIRNRGTVCGSIAHADPAAEQPGVLLALQGTVVAEGPAGRRQIPADEFFKGVFTTALMPEEMIVEVRFPRLPPGTGTSFVEVARRHGDFAVVGVAAALMVRDQICIDARIALVGVGPTPFRARDAEEFLKGRPAQGAEAQAAFREAARLISSSVEPVEDVHASSRYRKHLAGVLTERALNRALKRAEGGDLSWSESGV